MLAILETAEQENRSLLLTRLAEAQLEALDSHSRRQIDYDPVSRTGFFRHSVDLAGPAQVGVVSAGSSDVPVVREVTRTLAYHGATSEEINDIGVAGLWRLAERAQDLRELPILVVVAGMDAALASVVGGLAPGFIVAVPTSVGYGVATGGHTALHSMLASCAPGVAVVNIDNGYGAACCALRVLRAMLWNEG